MCIICTCVCHLLYVGGSKRVPDVDITKGLLHTYVCYCMYVCTYSACTGVPGIGVSLI